MAKAKAAKARDPNAWMKLPPSGNAFVVAPAETALRWTGRNGDRFRIVFHIDDEIIQKFPAELTPKIGHGGMPELRLASEAEAEAVVETLFEHLRALHPDTPLKKKKSGDMLRFVGDDIDYRMYVIPESAASAAFEEIEDSVDAWSWPIAGGGGEVLMWRLASHFVSVRATMEEIVYASYPYGEGGKLAAPIAGTPTAHGTWTFKSVMVGMDAEAVLANLKGVTSNKVTALSPLVNTVIKGKKMEDCGAVILPAEGRYRAETGEQDGVRWLRFVRA